MSTNRSGYFRYQDRNFGGKPPRYFYSVPCPTCRVESGQPCREAYAWFTRGTKKWANPHKDRVVRVRRIDEMKE